MSQADLSGLLGGGLFETPRTKAHGPEKRLPATPEIGPRMIGHRRSCRGSRSGCASMADEWFGLGTF